MFRRTVKKALGGIVKAFCIPVTTRQQRPRSGRVFRSQMKGLRRWCRDRPGPVAARPPWRAKDNGPSPGSSRRSLLETKGQRGRNRFPDGRNPFPLKPLRANERLVHRFGPQDDATVGTGSLDGDSAMASSGRFRLAVRRGSLAFAARLRRFARSKHGRATGAALVVLAALTWLRAESPWIVTELQERTFDAYQRLQPRAYADFPGSDRRDRRGFDRDLWPMAVAAHAPCGDDQSSHRARRRCHRLCRDLPRTRPHRAEADAGGSAEGRGAGPRPAMALLASLPDHDRCSRMP